MSCRCRSWLLVACALGCAGPQAEPPKEQRGALPAGVVAEVAGEPIGAERVARVAKAQGVTPAQARDLAVSDALFSLHAREQLSPARVRVVERAERARALYRQLLVEVEAAEPVALEELTRLTAERWLELDRPVSSRTSHAVVRLLEGVSEPQAEALAQRIWEATRGSEDAAAFEQRAKAVATGGLEVRVEALPAVTADGRVVDLERPAPQDMRFDLAFSRAASAIEQVGALSPVTRTAFGFHVIYLTERLPAVELTPEERRAALQDAVKERRVQQAEQAILSRSVTPEVSRAADSLTAELQPRP